MNLLRLNLYVTLEQFILMMFCVANALAFLYLSI